MKRRIGIVGMFPNDASTTRLIDALPLGQNDDWQLQGRDVFLEALRSRR